jgi:hypothetical protein
MRAQFLTIAMAAAFCFPLAANAAESDFLKSIDGQWSGGGTVLTRIGGKSVNVRCDIGFAAGSSDLSMQGTCRSLVVVSRSISAALKAKGTRYSGTYTGPSGQPSSLSGSRQGDSINLAVRWVRDINGDRSATMTIAKLGENRLRLQTIDKDPASGKSVVTSSIDLRQ